MKDSIDYIAYLVRNAKLKNLPKPIIFLGAGASASAGIPLANEIVVDIKDKFKQNPLIKNFIRNGEMDYYKVMGALTADERRDLFYSYITQDGIKINLTNLYLAQLLKEGYIDFILTVNFDDIILRACSLFNFLPPVYDISNVKVPTTSNFREKSVIYLHGQHFGQWLLNEPEELKKVSNDIANIFNEIKNKRTWIVVGYSGQDEIFNQIVKLGSFTSDLFWINYKDSTPSENVIKRLIDKPNINAHLIKGYDSDTFFLDLHSQLKMETPEIINKPFSFLKGIISNVKDITEYEGNNEHKEKYTSVKERMEISNSWIEKAISEIENNDSVEKFKQEIIEAYLKNDFEKYNYFIEKIKLPQFKNANIELSNFFNEWGINLRETFDYTQDEKPLIDSFEKFKLAISYNPKLDFAYNNLGNSIANLAILRKDKSLYEDAFVNYKKAIEINPNNDLANNNLAYSLSSLAKLESNEQMFYESFEKYHRAVEINNNEFLFYKNWADSLTNLADMKKDKKLFKESFEKFKKASEINSENESNFNNWANSLILYSRLLDEKDKKDIYFEALQKSKIAYSLNDKSSYNVACSYALLKDKNNSLQYLENCLSNNGVSKEHILKDSDWDFYKDDEDFIALLGKY